MTTPIDHNDPSQRMACLQRMDDALAMIHTLLAGTEAMRAAKATYLPPHSNESQSSYDSRISKAVLLNVLEDSIDNCVSRVFEEEMKLAEDAPQEMLDWCENIDLEGTTLHDFGRKLLRYALEDGIVHVLSDFPSLPADPVAANDSGLDPDAPPMPRVRTLADERIENVRPYLSVIRQEDLIALYTERVGGETICTHLRFKTKITRRVGFAEEEVERIHVLEPGFFQIYEQQEIKRGRKKEISWVVVEEGPIQKSANQPWDRVPVRTFIASETVYGPLEVKPPFKDLAFLNVRHWQSTADQQNILDVSRFPMLAVSGFSGPVRTPLVDPESGEVTEIEERQPFTVGPNTVLTTTDPAGKWYYVENGGASIEAGNKELSRLEEQMRVSGVEPLVSKQSGGITATERSIDESKARAPLEVWARNLGTFLEDCLDDMLDWENKEAEFSVHVNTEVGLGVGDGQDIQNIMQMRAMGEISRWTLYQELMRRGLLGPNFDPRLEAVRINLEMPDDVPEGDPADDPDAPADDTPTEDELQDQLEDPAPRRTKSKKRAEEKSKRRTRNRAKQRQRRRDRASTADREAAASASL